MKLEHCETISTEVYPSTQTHAGYSGCFERHTPGLTRLTFKEHDDDDDEWDLFMWQVSGPFDSHTTQSGDRL